MTKNTLTCVLDYNLTSENILTRVLDYNLMTKNILTRVLDYNPTTENILTRVLDYNMQEFLKDNLWKIRFFFVYLQQIHAKVD